MSHNPRAEFCLDQLLTILHGPEPPTDTLFFRTQQEFATSGDGRRTLASRESLEAVTCLQNPPDQHLKRNAKVYLMMEMTLFEILMAVARRLLIISIR